MVGFKHCREDNAVEVVQLMWRESETRMSSRMEKHYKLTTPPDTLYNKLILALFDTDIACFKSNTVITIPYLSQPA